MKNQAPPFAPAVAANALEPDADDAATQQVKKHNAKRGTAHKANVAKSAALLREMSARKSKSCPAK
jgi:hypothetical protein